MRWSVIDAMIGVICPSRFEYRALDHRKMFGKQAMCMVSGMGKIRAAYACSELLRRAPKIKAILLIGFAGALTDNLEIGAVVEPFTFIEQDYNAEPFETFPNLIKKKHAARLLKDSRDAVMLTQDKFLKENPYRGGPYEKKYKTLACDMESYAVAHFGHEARIRFSVVKLISDIADKNADHDFLKACRRLSPKLNRTVLASIEALRK